MAKKDDWRSELEQVADKLRDPFKMRMTVAAVMVGIMCFAINDPIHGRMKHSKRELNRMKSTVQTAEEVMLLRAKFDAVEDRIMRGNSNDVVVSHLIDIVRSESVDLMRIDAQAPERLGPMKSVRVTIDVNGSFRGADKASPPLRFRPVLDSSRNGRDQPTRARAIDTDDECDPADHKGRGMNPLVQRYLPPVIVFGAATFFGWPPSAPLDLGDDIIRTSSVRWRPRDLADPPLIEPATDPFREVLVVTEEMEVEPETGNLVVATRPAGPPADLLKAGLRLDGIASIGGRPWAVLNGRPRLAGDTVRTADAHRYECQIVSVENSHIVVRCEETITEIRPQPFGTGRPTVATESPAVPGDLRSPEIGDQPPPPQV